VWGYPQVAGYLSNVCIPMIIDVNSSMHYSNVYRKAQHIQDSYDAQHCIIESGALHVMKCEKIRRAYTVNSHKLRRTKRGIPINRLVCNTTQANNHVVLSKD